LDIQIGGPKWQRLARFPPSVRSALQLFDEVSVEHGFIRWRWGPSEDNNIDHMLTLINAVMSQPPPPDDMQLRSETIAYVRDERASMQLRFDAVDVFSEWASEALARQTVHELLLRPLSSAEKILVASLSLKWSIPDALPAMANWLLETKDWSHEVVETCGRALMATHPDKESFLLQLLDGPYYVKLFALGRLRDLGTADATAKIQTTMHSGVGDVPKEASLALRSIHERLPPDVRGGLSVTNIAAGALSKPK
jgi:hypothetical protein